MATSVSSAALRLPKLSPAILEIMRRRMQANRLTISKVIPNNLHEDTTKRKAAIFVTLCNQNDNPSILFTLRSENLGTHKGQVSFPGGHLEIGETAEKASIRETIEELGNGVGPLRIIGECQVMKQIKKRFIVLFIYLANLLIV
jgi:8-oxo-dGTP pyrophosphatase MutT (NUDIX family)